MTIPGGTGCENFQTASDPLLAGASDPHLLPGSPMVDAGDPAAPAIGALDLDGDARGLAGTTGCALPAAGRRDIGADEFVANCAPPPQGGATTVQKNKKCKKKRKRPGAGAAKKKRCKKKRKKR